MHNESEITLVVARTVAVPWPIRIEFIQQMNNVSRIAPSESMILPFHSFAQDMYTEIDYSFHYLFMAIHFPVS